MSSTHLKVVGEEGFRNPPLSIVGIIRNLGPGLIIAGSIVGSGELIATTKTGAEAGFSLLWLVIIGCVIKVFVQVELGRYTIVTGKTAMEGLDSVPGPRLRVNWLLWYWLIMFVVSMAQLGGIVGGVGQALAIASPLTESGRAFNEYQDVLTKGEVSRALALQESPGETPVRFGQENLEIEETTIGVPPDSNDDVIWAAVVTVLTSVLLVVGRYRLVQALATAFVALFTFVSIGNLIHLQSLPDWRISSNEILEGLSFGLPSVMEGVQITPLVTALAAFGIIGVGATELIQYPYWCVEKGYARWTGPRDNTREWVSRAKGWLRVLHWDAWCSAIVYTFATVVFYLLGAAVLGRVGLNPEGTSMVRTLLEMYVPVFGSIAQSVFLFGAVAVLYSTFFVANAGHARVCADALRVFGLSSGEGKAIRFWTRVFSGFFPFACLVVYVYIRAPVALVLASGVMQAIMLPMLGGAALYFRYRQGDKRLTPSLKWDVLLWISFIGLLIAGAWLAVSKLMSLF